MSDGEEVTEHAVGRRGGVGDHEDVASVDVALGVVEVKPGLGVDAAHRADHLRGEQDVVDRDHLEQQVDARLVIDAGVEEDVLHHVLGQRRPLAACRRAREAAPVIGHRAAAVRDDEAQRREVLEQVDLMNCMNAVVSALR
jgi:hypothetical protein